MNSSFPAARGHSTLAPCWIKGVLTKFRVFILPTRKHKNKHLQSLQCLPTSVLNLKFLYIMLERAAQEPWRPAVNRTERASTYPSWDHGSRAEWNISSWAASPLRVGAELSSTQNPTATEAIRDANRLLELGRYSQWIHDNNLNDNQRKCIKKYQGDSFVAYQISKE